MDKSFYGIFCDDIRHELSGKFTLVGCYSDHLLVAQVPTTLPKLCLHFNYRCAAVDAPSNIQVIVERDGKPFFNIEADIEHDELVDAEANVTLNGGFEMHNIEITEKSILRAKIVADGNEVLGPQLTLNKINQKPQHDPAC